MPPPSLGAPRWNGSVPRLSALMADVVDSRDAAILELKLPVGRYSRLLITLA